MYAIQAKPWKRRSTAKQGPGPKPRLWPFGYDDAACKDADNAGEEEKPPRISPRTPASTIRNTPETSQIMPRISGELDCRRQGIRQKYVPAAIAGGAPKIEEEILSIPSR